MPGVGHQNAAGPPLRRIGVRQEGKPRDRDAVEVDHGVRVLDLLVLSPAPPSGHGCPTSGGADGFLAHRLQVVVDRPAELVGLVRRCGARRWRPAGRSAAAARACPAGRRPSCPGSVRHIRRTAPGRPARPGPRCRWQPPPRCRGRRSPGRPCRTRSPCQISTLPGERHEVAVAVVRHLVGLVENRLGPREAASARQAAGWAAATDTAATASRGSARPGGPSSRSRHAVSIAMLSRLPDATAEPR